MWYAALFLLAVPLLAQQPSLPTVEKERALGRDVAQSLQRGAAPFDVPVADAYVQRIADRLLAQLDDRAYNYEFSVVHKANALEPVGLPGGFIVVPAPTFLTVADEDEFAGLLAHTIGHVALRQGIRTVERAQSGGASVPLIFTGGWTASHISAGASQVLMPLSFAKPHREDELSADAFGVRLAARAGFSGAGLREYIRRVQSERTQNPFLPPREIRLARIDDLLAGMPSNPAVSSSEFEAVQRAVRAAIAREQPDRPPTLRRARADR